MNKNLRSIISTSAILITIVSSAFLATPASAKVYKWVDENGQVHYGEKPGNTQAEQVQIRTNETTTPRAIDKEKQDYLEGSNKAESEKAEELKEQKMINKEKRKYCNEAKSDLEAIMSRGRTREINEKGEYTYLTEEQRQQRISAAKKKQKEFCH